MHIINLPLTGNMTFQADKVYQEEKGSHDLPSKQLLPPPPSKHPVASTSLRIICTCSFVYKTNVFIKWSSRGFYFHEIDKIASESSYKTMKLWEIHNFIFTKSLKIMKIWSSVQKGHMVAAGD